MHKLSYFASFKKNKKILKKGIYKSKNVCQNMDKIIGGISYMAKIFYGTGINKDDVVVCASKISTASKSAEIGKKYSTMKDLSTKKAQELSF